MRYTTIISAFLLLFLIACKATKNNGLRSNDPASQVLSKTLHAHGGTLYDEAHFSFVFRKKKYTFHNKKDGYQYTTRYTKDGQEILDVLSNTDFIRTIDGKEIPLSSKDKSRYGASVNSVIYFATLPHKLTDPAVNLSYKGETKVKGKRYQILEVKFDKEGGGKDHDDEFYYWINMDTHLIDYLAYNYTVNGGGVRFRSAYNKRQYHGIHFQDYVNYKAAVGTALSELPQLYEEGKLEELSRIETEDVRLIDN